MKRFVEGDDRKQVPLLPECVDDCVGQDNPVRVIDTFVDELDLAGLGFNGTYTGAHARDFPEELTLLRIMRGTWDQ